jgi:N-acetylneuraminic acid mutarotase
VEVIRAPKDSESALIDSSGLGGVGSKISYRSRFMKHGRGSGHTATLLPNGRVLVTGGMKDDGGPLSSAELYDPVTETWSVTASMSVSRSDHAAVLLPDGRVLVAGGVGVSLAQTQYLNSVEIYNPLTGTWSSTGSLSGARMNHSMVLLPNGRVLVTGGEGPGVVSSVKLATSEIYNPITGAWSATGSMTTPRWRHSTTLLVSGRVLVAGGHDGSAVLSSSEVFNPSTGTWSLVGAMPGGRWKHTATALSSGLVMVIGGLDGSGAVLSSTVSFNPATNSWSARPSLTVARMDHSATLLPNGKVLVAGGQGISGYLKSCELFDLTQGFSVTGSLSQVRTVHLAIVLPQTTQGRVLVVGGTGKGESYSHVSSETYDPQKEIWNSVETLATGTARHTATVLQDGRLLVTGGTNGLDFMSRDRNQSEIFDPKTGDWGRTWNPLFQARSLHTSTLLQNGRVLVVGGLNFDAGPLSSVEIFDPTIEGWSLAEPLTNDRHSHSASLLPNGKVLIAGGSGGVGYVAQAEVFDPSTGQWSGAGSLNEARSAHSATVLLSGEVLVVGGENGLVSSELYQPSTGIWTFTGPMTEGRAFHTATRLLDGRVLVAGGFGISGDLSSAEIYDPLNGTWAPTAPMASARSMHTATLLPNGKVLVLAGGQSLGYSSLSSAEVYDPQTGTWREVTSLFDARSGHTSSLMPDGRIFVFGGFGDGFDFWEWIQI